MRRLILAAQLLVLAAAQLAAAFVAPAPALKVCMYVCQYPNAAGSPWRRA